MRTDTNVLDDPLNSDDEDNLRNQAVESDNGEPRDKVDLALEAWSIDLQKEWSFYNFMLHGQMQESLECIACSEEREEYNLFYDICVPLKECERITLNIIIKRTPIDIKNLLNSKKKKKDEQEVEETLEEMGARDKLLDNYNKLANDQPISLTINVHRDILIGDLVNKIVEDPSVNISKKNFLEDKFTDIILYTMNEIEVVGVFDRKFKLTQYKLSNNVIYAQEVLADNGEDEIVKKWQNNPWIEKETNVCKYWVEDAKLKNGFAIRMREKRKKRGFKEAGEREDDERYTTSYLFNNYFEAAKEIDTLW